MANSKPSIPDTLDLSDIARRALRGMDGMSDPDAAYEQYWLGGWDAKGPCMLHDVNDWCESKWLGPMALLRQVTGEGLTDADRIRMDRLRSMAHPDGGFYEDVESRPWAADFGFGGDTYATETGKRYMMAGMNGRYAEAALMYWKITGDDSWKEMATKAIHRCGELMTVRNKANPGEEYAYFRQSSVFLEGAGPQDDAPEPPRSLNHCGVWTGQGALTLYRLTGDERALEISIQLARYLLNQSRLVENDGDFGVSHFVGEGANVPLVHFHLNALVRCFLLDLGVEIQDPRMIEAGRTGFYWGYRHGNPLMGFFPEAVRHGDADSIYSTTCEICAVADMIHLGLLMSTRGLQDVWDDVDAWVRNMFVAGQIRETEWMHAYGEQHAKGHSSRFDMTEHKTYDHVPERLQGTWAGWIAPNQLKEPGNGPHFSLVMNCCTGNAVAQLYRVWRDMAAFEEETETLRVNLLLNKSMPEAEIRSWLPHEGKVEVEIRETGARKLAIRLPRWVDKTSVESRASSVPRLDGNHLIFEGLAPGDIITVEFPIEEREETLHIMGKDWPVILRGSTIVDIQPRGEFGAIFNRPEMRSPKTPQKLKTSQPPTHAPVNW